MEEGGRVFAGCSEQTSYGPNQEEVEEGAF